jgi:TnpA family transposase
LCLNGLGTNAGLKRMNAIQHGATYKDLLYARRRYVTVDQLREVIATVANGTLNARDPLIWGEGTNTCASDSKHFGAWDQNLTTQWHIRYGGRGVMIYWHVERKSLCIHSQRLYRPEAGKPDAYPNLQPVLSRPIDWELIRRQYDEMVKYATALRLGTAEAEAILRRFTRENVQHPTYKALAELGKAVKTTFLCRYVHDQALRREINDGLNVVEHWNSANDFIFFARRGEFSSNRREDQELSMLSLHLLQNCMVYVNTLMVQQVLTRPEWKGRLTPRDLHALTPLFWGHVNPYGRFDLDMRTRLDLN